MRSPLYRDDVLPLSTAEVCPTVLRRLPSSSPLPQCFHRRTIFVSGLISHHGYCFCFVRGRSLLFLELRSELQPVQHSQSKAKQNASVCKAAQPQRQVKVIGRVVTGVMCCAVVSFVSNESY